MGNDENYHKKNLYILFIFFLGPNRLLWLYSNVNKRKIISSIIRFRLRKYTVSISEGAIISDKAIFPHPQGIVIGKGVVIKDFVGGLYN